MSASLASGGALGSSSSFLSAISALYNYAYLSSTTTAAATASLAAGTTTAAAYSSATSSAAVSAATAAIAASPASAALACALLAAAANGSSNAAAASQYRTLCLASPPPPPSAAVDYTWLAPLVVCTVAGIIITSVTTVFVVRRFRSSAYATGRNVDQVVNDNGRRPGLGPAKQVGGPEVVFMSTTANPAAAAA